MRTRVRLLVQLTTRHGRYRCGLVQAARSLNPQEAAVLADLEAHGLDVNQLRDVLGVGTSSSTIRTSTNAGGFRK
jgi:hypothetical protein